MHKSSQIMYESFSSLPFPYPPSFPLPLPPLFLSPVHSSTPLFYPLLLSPSLLAPLPFSLSLSSPRLSLSPLLFLISHPLSHLLSAAFSPPDRQYAHSAGLIARK